MMSSPAIKSSPTEDAGKLKSMVLILREENQALKNENKALRDRIEALEKHLDVEWGTIEGGAQPVVQVDMLGMDRRTKGVRRSGSSSSGGGLEEHSFVAEDDPREVDRERDLIAMGEWKKEDGRDVRKSGEGAVHVNGRAYGVGAGVGVGDGNDDKRENDAEKKRRREWSGSHHLAVKPGKRGKTGYHFTDDMDAKLLIAVTDLIRENAQSSSSSSTTSSSTNGSDDKETKNIMYLFDWVEIAERVSGGSSDGPLNVQCSRRWRTHVNPEVRALKGVGAFTEEEDRLLAAYVECHGGKGLKGCINWGGVVEALKGKRNTMECQNRHHTLKRLSGKIDREEKNIPFQKIEKKADAVSKVIDDNMIIHFDASVPAPDDLSGEAVYREHDAEAEGGSGVELLGGLGGDLFSTLPSSLSASKEFGEVSDLGDPSRDASVSCVKESEEDCDGDRDGEAEGGREDHIAGESV